MTDHIVFCRFIFIFFKKLCRSRKCDLRNVLFYLFGCHTKTVIDKFHCLFFRIDNYFDLCLIIFGKFIFSHHIKLFQLRNRIAAI